MELEIRRQTTPDLRSLSLLLYGFQKVGKTDQASKFPEPLLLELEPQGAQFVLDIDIQPIANLSGLESRIDKILRLPHKTLIFDSVTWFLEQEAKNTDTTDPRAAYKRVGDRFIPLLTKALRAGKIVIATGHSRKVVIKDEGPKEFVEIRPDLNPDLGDGLLGMFSVICYCFPGVGGKSQMLTKPSVTEKRRILAGDRSGKLPEIMDLSADAIMSHFRKLAQKPAPAPETASK